MRKLFSASCVFSTLLSTLTASAQPVPPVPAQTEPPVEVPPSDVEAQPAPAATDAEPPDAPPAQEPASEAAPVAPREELAPAGDLPTPEKVPERAPAAPSGEPEPSSGVLPVTAAQELPPSDPNATPETAPVAVAPEAPPPVVEEKPEASLWPLTISTSMLTRFELREGYDTLGVSQGRTVEGDATFYRARFGLRTSPLKLTDDLDVLVQFTPQAAGEYGKIGTVSEQELGLFEGYAQFRTPQATLEVGRFAMSYGDEVVIGYLDWNNVGRAFEGIRVRHFIDEAWVDAFITQTPRGNQGIAEGHPVFDTPLFAGDTYFWGLYAGLGPLVSKKMEMDVYALGLSNGQSRNIPVDLADPSAGTFTRSSATEVTFGLRVKNRVFELLDYRLEGGIQFGDRPNPLDDGDTTQSVSAFMIDGEFGATLTKRVHLAIGGNVASGDDPETTDTDEGWNQLYPTAHKWLGLMDVIGARTNVWSVNAKGWAKLTPTTTLNVHGHLFSRMVADGPGSGPAGEKNFAGGEVDAFLVQQIGGPFKLHGLYGIFIPNDGQYGSSDAAHYVEIGGRLTY